MWFIRQAQYVGVALWWASVGLLSVAAEPDAPAILAMLEADGVLEAPAMHEPPDVYLKSDVPLSVPEGIKAITFDGVNWRGQPTRVFAYYGIPAGASSDHPVPGVILIHGAGGTAFHRWVQAWVDQGYAAIAIDHDGGLPIGKYSNWLRNPDMPGPKRGDITQLKWAVKDQWMYHALGSAMLAHSLLASMPEVDGSKIGATGISWGGVILANLAGLDNRLKFAAPVYGCGFIGDETDDGSTFVGKRGSAEQRKAWFDLWDPQNFLPHANVPLLWINGTNDFAFTMSSWQRSYVSAPGTRALSLNVGMKHTHGAISEQREDIFAFADMYVRSGMALPSFEKMGVERDQTAWAQFDTKTPLKRAIFYYSNDSGKWQDRQWKSLTASIDELRGKVSARPPEGCQVYFFNVTDERGLTVSSPHVELK